MKDKWIMGRVHLDNDASIPVQEKYSDFLDRLYPDSGAPVNTIIYVMPDDSGGSIRVCFTKSGVSFEKI
jgi:hypothetical protein